MITESHYIGNSKYELFHDMIEILRRSFVESLSHDELVNMNVPYDFQLQTNKMFSIRINNFGRGRFHLSMDMEQVSRSHHLDCITFRVLIDQSYNGDPIG